MCLILARPRGVAVPEALLASACAFNPHGFGLMHLTADGARIHRRRQSDVEAVLERVRSCGEEPFVLHFRYRTSGPVDLMNTHPIPVGARFQLFHNGTVRPDEEDRDSRSDTTTLAEHYLSPILERRPELVRSRRLHDLVLAWLGPGHRLVLVDQVELCWHIINEEAGFDLGGLWLSNERWFDPNCVDGIVPRALPKDSLPMFAA